MCDADTAAAPLRRKSRRSLAARTARSIGEHISEVLDNEELASREAFLQRIEPRARLVTLLLLTVTTSLIRSPFMLAAVILATLVLAAASKVDLGSFARKVWASAGLLAVMVAAPAMTRLITPGDTLVPMGALTLTVPGVLGALTLVLRVVASSGIALLMVWTMRWTDLLDALSALKVPDVIVATLAMTQKQIVALMRTVQQIHLAKESRALSNGTAQEERRWVVGRMAFVVQKSVKTAEDVYDAMLARGFSGTIRSIGRARPWPRSWHWVMAGGIMCALVLGLDRMASR